MELLICLVILWTIFAALGYYVATQKGRPGAEGLILGFLYGPLGCLIAALLPTAKRPSPRAARGGTPSHTVWTPEYRVGWDAPPEEDPDDAVEDQVMDFLNAAGGKPRDAIDLGAIADAARCPRDDGGPIDLTPPRPDVPRAPRGGADDQGAG